VNVASPSLPDSGFRSDPGHAKIACGNKAFPFSHGIRKCPIAMKRRGDRNVIRDSSKVPWGRVLKAERGQGEPIRLRRVGKNANQGRKFARLRKKFFPVRPHQSVMPPSRPALCSIGWRVPWRRRAFGFNSCTRGSIRSQWPLTNGYKPGSSTSKHHADEDGRQTALMRFDF